MGPCAWLTRKPKRLIIATVFMARTRQCTHTEITSTGCVAATVAANVAATVYSDRYTVYLSIRNYKNV